MTLSAELQVALSQNIIDAKKTENDSREVARMMGEAAQKREAASQQAGTVIGRELQTQASFDAALNAELDKQMKLQDFKKGLNYEALSMDIAERTAAETARMIGLSEQIAKKKSVSFVQNPIAALANEFSLPWDEQELRGSTEKLTLLNQAKERLDARLVSANQAADAVKETLTADAASSLKSAMAARLQVEAADAELKTLGVRTDALRLVREGRNETVNALLKQQQMLNTEEERAERRALRELRLKQMKDTDEGRAEVIKTIRDGLRLDAGNPEAVAALSDAELLRGYSEGQKTEFGRIVLQAYDNASMKQLGRIHVHGANPFDAIEFRTKVGWTGKNPIQTDIAEAYKANFISQHQPKMKVEEQAQLAASAWKTKMQNWETVVPGDKENPLARATVTFASIPEQFPGFLKDSPAATLLLPLMQGEATKDQPINPQLVFNTLAEAVARKQLSPQQAAITQENLFKRVLAQANETSGIGTISGDTFKSYSSVIEAPSVGSKFLTTAGAIGVSTVPAVAATGVGTPVALGLLGASSTAIAIGRGKTKHSISLTSETAKVAELFQNYALQAQGEQK